jgi:transcriptional regulator with XRE-family HTH domain
MQVHTGRHSAFAAVIRREQRIFAAKLRVTRAVLGWSQTDLANQAGLTQRAVHKLEQGDTEPRRATVAVMKHVWLTMGFTFEDLPDGAFRLTVPATALDQTSPRRAAAGRGPIGAIKKPRRCPAGALD